MSAEASLKAIFDRLQYGITRQKLAWGTIDPLASGFWYLVDSAGDQDFENVLKGSDITDLDIATQNSSYGDSSCFVNLFTLINSYLSNKLGITTTPPLAGYLNDKKWRVPYDVNLMMIKSKGAAYKLPTHYVFPKGILPANGVDPATSGMHKFIRLTGTAGNPTQTVVDGALDRTYIKGSAIVCVNVDATPETSNLTLKVTLQDGVTTKNILVELTDTAQYEQNILGKQAIGSAGAAGGQKVIPLAATGQFTAQEYVLICSDNGKTQEVGKIASIVTDTSITLEENLVNSFAEDDVVIPLFTNVEWHSGTLGNSKKVDIYAMPDRTVAL